jgi:hypothetical protein
MCRVAAHALQEDVCSIDIVFGSGLLVQILLQDRANHEVPVELDLCPLHPVKHLCGYVWHVGMQVYSNQMHKESYLLVQPVHSLGDAWVRWAVVDLERKG